MRITILLLFILSSRLSSGQILDSLYTSQQGVEPFTLENLFEHILKFHPVVKQARLLSENAQQEIRLARGAFDPKIETKFQSKEFNGKDYYNKWNASLSFPSWFPIDPKVGIERNTGVFIDPENTVPDADNNRQLFTGINIPLGKGLFTDERRASLKQAKLFLKMAEAEQIKLINKILLEASKDYWQWYYAFYNLKLMSKNAEIGGEILKRVKLNASLGEASAIDTVQAEIIFQQRKVEKQEAQVELTNTNLKMSTYFWDDEGNPLLLPDQVMPVLQSLTKEIVNEEVLTTLTEAAKVNHPELKKLGSKIAQLEIDRRLAAEYIKPRFDLSYNFLNQPIGPSGEFNAMKFSQNYKFGLDFSMPILIRKERAKLAQSKIKIKSTFYERANTEREIIYQINTVYNQIKNTALILEQQRGVANNYERLLRAEMLNLENGESDLFKINVQQEKLIQSQNKVLKLQSEYEKLKITLLWAAGAEQLSYSSK